MHLVLSLLAIQVVLGAFDSFWHHEVTERLPAKRAARMELALHALRELIYAFVFVAIAWWSWRGVWSFVLAGILIIEVVTTLADFVIEDATRRLPKLERTLHTLLAINFGAILAVFAPTLLEWAMQPTGIASTDYGAWSWFFTVCGAGVLIWGLRDAYAALKHFRPTPWQRRALKPAVKASAKRILITGATGFIGRQLTYRLVERGDHVLVLARNPDKAADLFGPHVQIVTTLGAIAGEEPVDCIVNLAGASIAGGIWTAHRKRLLLQSRLTVTNELLGLVGRLARKPSTWINASAVGYYGVRRNDDCLHEKSPPQPIFQSQLCRTWEATATEAAAHGVKVALLRIGLVLGRGGGALPALARPVRFGLGAVLGSGRQWVSWIHLHDLIELILFVIDQETLAGPVNATAPTPVRHRELMQMIGATLHRRLLPFSVPAALLRAVLGEIAELFVDGQRVVPDRATALGFRFRYATIDTALKEVFDARPARYFAATASAVESSAPGSETE